MPDIQKCSRLSFLFLRSLRLVEVVPQRITRSSCSTILHAPIPPFRGHFPGTISRLVFFSFFLSFVFHPVFSANVVQQSHRLQAQASSAAVVGEKKKGENVMLGLTQAPYPVPNCGNRRTRFRKPSQSACFAYKLRLWQVPAGNQEGNSAYDSHVQQFALLSPGGEKAGNFEMHLYCIDQDALHR